MRAEETQSAYDQERLESPMPEQQVPLQTHIHLLNEAFRSASAASHVEGLRQELFDQCQENLHLRNELSLNAAELEYQSQQGSMWDSRASYKLFAKAMRTVDAIFPEGSYRSRALRLISRTLKSRRRASIKPKQIETVTLATESAEIPLPVLAARAARSIPYGIWARDTTPSQVENKMSQREIASLGYQPVISLMTPVYDPPLNALHDTIESVLGQLYGKWELCLVDGGSKNPAIRQLLKLYAKQDSRITVRLLDGNQGISGNTNEAARLATGEFVQILDHDDTLEPTTLLEAVKALNRDPTLDILYFDEDKLSADGARREEPFFKPDWSPEMLLSVNYLTHCVIRRSLYEAVGGCDSEMDGAQDWDLAFRLTERTDRIHHIPKVLYHWRKVPGSAAASVSAKPYAYDRQLRSITSHLERKGIAHAQAEFSPISGTARATWPVTEELVSIIIPTRDNLEVLQRCLDTLFNVTTYQNLELILVDTGSVQERTHAYYSKLKADPQVRDRLKIVEYTGQFNYSRANNVGASHSSGSLLLFLNNDIAVLRPDWLHELVRWAQLPEIGVVGTQLLYPSGYVQHVGVVVGMAGHAAHVFAGLKPDSPTMFGSINWYRNYMAVTGACMMTRRSVFDEIGGFDEEYLVAFSDVEYCLHAYDKGYRILSTPFASLNHHEGASRGSHIPLSDIHRAYERWYARVDQGDPYYNANLSTGVSVPVLATNDAPERLVRLQRVVRQFEFLFPPDKSQ